MVTKAIKHRNRQRPFVYLPKHKAVVHCTDNGPLKLVRERQHVKLYPLRQTKKRQKELLRQFAPNVRPVKLAKLVYQTPSVELARVSHKKHPTPLLLKADRKPPCELRKLFELWQLKAVRLQPFLLQLKHLRVGEVTTVPYHFLQLVML